jgi:hypothetical protein
MNEIVKHQPVQEIDIEEIKRVAMMMVCSDFFQVGKDQTQAIAQIGVKILAGREMGYGAFASVQGIHVIQGKPTVSANLMAAAVKAHPRYNYKVVEMTDDKVSIQFYEDGQPSGVSEFTKADATLAGLTGKDIWKKFPRNMLFSRALSNGVRWFTPDVFNGSTMYTPDEIDADVTIDMATGEVITNGTQQAPRQPQPPVIAPTLPTPQAEKKATMPAVEKKEEEVKPWLDWKDGNAAKKAAIENGWCSNDFEAKNSLLNSLEAITGQKEQWQPSKQNEVFHHFYDKHMKRKGELKEAA